MRPIFTIHAGEFIVGEHLERKFKGLNIWVPTKDTGVDLLAPQIQKRFRFKLSSHATI
jgi:hypothetical protein